MEFANSVKNSQVLFIYSKYLHCFFLSNHTFEGQLRSVSVSYKDQCLTWT